MTSLVPSSQAYTVEGIKYVFPVTQKQKLVACGTQEFLEHSPRGTPVQAHKNFKSNSCVNVLFSCYYLLTVTLLLCWPMTWLVMLEIQDQVGFRLFTLLQIN